MNKLRDLIEKKRNKTQISAHIYGSGKSVKRVKLLSISGLKIAVGDMPWRAPNLGPYDYWVTNNTYFPIPWRAKDLKIINKSGALTLISTNCANLPENYKNLMYIQNKLELILSTENIILYDTHHFYGNTDGCIGKACATLNEKFSPGKTIQEELGLKFFMKEIPYLNGYATINALALAILLNCNPIFIHGVELPEFTKDYKYYRNFSKITTLGFKMLVLRIKEMTESNFRKIPSDFSGEARIQLLRDFEAVGSLAESADISIFFTNKESPLNNLPGYKFWNLID